MGRLRLPRRGVHSELDGSRIWSSQCLATFGVSNAALRGMLRGGGLAVDGRDVLKRI